MFNAYATVILDIAVGKELTYGIPSELLGAAQPGVRVEVSVRGAVQQGYVYELKESSEYAKVLPIRKIVSDSPLLTKELLQLALWMARYTCTPLHKVLQVFVPSVIRSDQKHKEQLYVMRAQTREKLIEMCTQIRSRAPLQAAVLEVMLQVTKGILLTELLEQSGASAQAVKALAEKGALKVDIVRIDRSPLINEEYFKSKPKQLNNEQAEALKKICHTLDQQAYETHLLYGITGSGKTEIYLQAIAYALEQGKGAIVLVPEIALTQQIIERFRSRFETAIAVLHHRLSPGERFDEWHRIREGKARIVIGARSAIFCPVENLGLIIVDEEHESSYKQSEESPYYHARDIAVMRGHFTRCAVVLGSATPSLESFHNAMIGKYTLSRLSHRAEAAASLPSVTIVDMKREYEKGNSNFSDALLTAIKKRIEIGEQTLLFLNRRGYHTALSCQGCGKAIKCRQCDIALTFHKGDNVLSCHLCDFTYSPPPKSCPECGATETMKFRGVGTEQIERALHVLFPQVRTIRLDADTTKHKGSHQKLLREFASGKADVLIGTQMIAKGLHFPMVTLVGVLNSDASLNIPDFRASESVFQLITQVAGRSGRGEMKGEVILQTSVPENPTIVLASKQDFDGFYAQEIAVREAFGYPPFTKLAKLTFSSEEENAALGCAEAFYAYLNGRIPSHCIIHPVVPSGYAKVKNRYRFQILLRSKQIGTLLGLIEQAKKEVAVSRETRLSVDINPLSML